MQQEEAAYDPARHRKSKRSGAQRGVWVYVAAPELRKAGIDPHGPAPEYRLWGTRSGGLMGRLYKA